VYGLRGESGGTKAQNRTITVLCRVLGPGPVFFGSRLRNPRSMLESDNGAPLKTPQHTTFGCACSNRLGINSFGNVTKRALDLAVEIGSQGKDVFGSTLVSAAG
jgi:hypothetical protein